MPALARHDIVVSIGHCLFKEIVNKHLCFDTGSGPGIHMILRNPPSGEEIVFPALGRDWAFSLPSGKGETQ